MQQPGLLRWLFVFGTSLFASCVLAGEARIAVAANFTDAMREIAALFEHRSGHTTRISYGSTGKLYAQIENGAPFDLFLAADMRRPQMAEQHKLAVPGSLMVYARGRLALWSAQRGRFGDGEAYLRTANFHHLAIANPKTAPYGLAAQQALQHLGLWSALQPRLVYGDSIAQTFQFAVSGNAEAGFIACSQRTAWPDDQGSTWIVPDDYYAPIAQAAVLLHRGADNPAANAFLDFLRGDSARAVIERYGYGVDGRLHATDIGPGTAQAPR